MSDRLLWDPEASRSRRALQRAMTEWLAARCSGPTLVVGAGSGELVLRLARAGVPVGAVEANPDARDRLRLALAREAGMIERLATIIEGSGVDTASGSWSTLVHAAVHRSVDAPSELDRAVKALSDASPFVTIIPLAFGGHPSLWMDPRGLGGFASVPLRSVAQQLFVSDDGLDAVWAAEWHKADDNDAFLRHAVVASSQALHHLGRSLAVASEVVAEERRAGERATRDAAAAKVKRAQAITDLRAQVSFARREAADARREKAAAQRASHDALAEALGAAHAALERQSVPTSAADASQLRLVASRIADAENAAVAAKHDADVLRHWRGVKVGIALAESAHPRRLLGLPRRLWRALRRRPAPPVPEEVTSHQVIGSLGVSGLRLKALAYPHLRVIHWGSSRTYEATAPHRPLDDVDQQIDDGADLFLLEPGIAPPDIDLEEPAASFAAAGIPVVLFARRPSHLDLVTSVTVVVTESPQVATAAAERFGAEAVMLIDPSVDMSIFNPMGWQRDPEGGPVAFIGTAPLRPRLDWGILFDSEIDLFRMPWGTRPRLRRSATDLATVGEVVRQAHDHTAAVESAELHIDEPAYLRQLLQLAATGTPVVTTGSPRLGDVIPGDLVSVVSSAAERSEALAKLADPVHRERASVRLRRHVLSHHTTRHRFEELLDRLDIPRRRPERISILFVTNRPDFLDHAYDNFRRQDYPDLELITVFHGDRFTDVDVEALEATCDFHVHHITAPEEWTLGDCLNAAIDAAGGHFVTKMDDDDFYGPHHLSDLVLAYEYSQADIVGKPADFVYLDDLNLMVQRETNATERYALHVGGPTMLMRRAIAQRFEFLRRRNAVDVTLYWRVSAAGLRIYSTHAFGFVLNRHGRRHTWDVDHREMAADARGSWPGMQAALVDLQVDE